MNFLQLCKSVCREAGLAGGESAITAVTNQVGEMARIVNYVRNALIEIENLHISDGDYLRYMRRGFTLTTVAATAAYAYNAAQIVDDLLGTAIPRFTCWFPQDDDLPMRSYLQSSGAGTQGYLPFLHWKDFVRRYRVGTQIANQPFNVTVDNQDNLVLGPTPNGAYIVNGDYLIGPQVLAADDDTPSMPAKFHNVIVWRALRDYGLYENAPEVVTRADDSYGTWLGMLEGNQLVQINIAGPLC